MEAEKQSDEVLVEALPQPVSYKRLWCAMLSAVVPGLGDRFIGEGRRAALFLGLLVALLLCYWPLRLPGIFWALISLVYAGVALNVTSSCLTLLSKRTRVDAAADWWVLVLVPIAVVAGALELNGWLRASGFRIFTVTGSSMSPAVDAGEMIVVDQRYFRNHTPETGEVVMFNHQDSVLIKRIIATGGMTIQGSAGEIDLDNRLLNEGYVIHSDPRPLTSELNSFGPTVVPAGQLFVMGDNRDVSLDSRVRSGEFAYGPVLVGDVIGKPLYVFGYKGNSNRYGLQIH